MTAAPASVGDAISVAPSSLSGAAASVSGLGGEVRAATLRPVPDAAIANQACSDALYASSRLVAQALESAAHLLEETARALHAAAGAYGLADLVAVAPGSG